MKKYNFIDTFINLILLTTTTLLLFIIYKDLFVNLPGYENYYTKYYIILVVNIFLWLGIKKFFSSKQKVYANIITISIFFSFYLIELYFSNIIYLTHNSKQVHNYDLRTKFQVLEDLKDEKVAPSISPKYYLIKKTGKIDIAPISGISNKKTVMCNESGKWITYKSDRYGFNNNDIIWDENIFNNFVLGDSFAYGACVEQNESISGQLNLLGFKSANLAYSGNGPLYMLASLKEYSVDNKIDYIIWAFYEGNDLIDLERELSFKNFNLQNYLQPNFTQNLKDKQIVVDNLLQNFYIEKQKEELKKGSLAHLESLNQSGIIGTSNKFDFKKFIKLYYVRNILNLSSYKHKESTKEKFFSILNEAKIFSENIDSKFLFVYLPRFSRNMKFANNYEKDEILKGVSELNIDFLDMDSLVFKKHKDPLSLFPFRRKNHYTNTGYKLIAEEISKHLKN